MKENTERLRYECSRENLRRSKAWQETANEQNGLAKTKEDDTLSTAKEEKGIEVHTIGKIDKNIYKCVTEDIVTDEVIITDERIAHIERRHPGDYERYHKYIADMVSNPDYVIKDERPYTATILKEFKEMDTNKCFRLALRLITSVDDQGLKNSIITFMKVREKEYNRLVKNKEVLYNKE